MLSRRSLILTSASFVGAALMLSGDASARNKQLEGTLRGSLGVTPTDLFPDSRRDQSAALMKWISEAAKRDLPLYLPPGSYKVANLVLPDYSRICGVPGATRLIFSGGDFLMNTGQSDRIELFGLVLEGGNQPLSAEVNGLIQMSGVNALTIENCDITGSSKYGLWIEKSGGKIIDTKISHAELSAIYTVNSTGMRIQDNDISECGNGGILVHRLEKGPDGTLVRGNRVGQIGATAGGTGQNGNGINVFRADNVEIVDNLITDCAFSAIRSNAGSGVQIIGNQCHRSGETAIYSEFGFEGAIVANNLIDAAANGISIVNFNEGGRLATVSGNIIRNMKAAGPYPAEGIGFGIGISAEAETAITGNVIEGAAKWGMALGWGPYLRNVSVSGNIIRNATVGIAVSTVDGIGGTLISGNQMSETPNGAIVGFHWNDAATADLTVTGSSPDKHLMLANNQSL